MDAKVFNLSEGNGLILVGLVVRRFVPIRICSKRTNVDFATRHCSHWIHHNRQKRFYKQLLSKREYENFTS